MQPLSVIQRAVVMYSAEFGSQILIKTFMDRIPVIAYNFESFFPESKTPHPASGTVYVSKNHKIHILKWIIDRDGTNGSWYMEVVILNVQDNPGIILDAKGTKNISRLRSDTIKRIAIVFDTADATHTAEEIIKWLQEEIKEGDNNEKG